MLLNGESNAAPHFDVAIVGGGMVGVSLALMLAQAFPHRSFALIEAHTWQPDISLAPSEYVGSFDARSTALSPSSVAAFHTLGVWADLESYATAIEKIHVSDRSHVGIAEFDRGDNDGDALGYVIENRGFGLVLWERLREASNIHVFAPQQVSEVRPVAGGAELLASDGDVFCMAELAVIADGANSPLRSRLGIGCREKDYGQHAVVTNVAYDSSHCGRAFERFTDEGPMALLPLGGDGRSRMSALIWTFPADDLPKALAWSDDEFLENLQARFGFRLGNFTRVGQRFSYPLKLVVADEQVRSSVVVMGNAAHFLHPVAGQGFNLSMRDNLRLLKVLKNADKLSDSFGLLAVLEEYEKAQALDQQRTIFVSDSFNEVFTQSSPAVITGRNLGILSVELSDVVRQQFIGVLSGKAS